jgi:hypothetical protein
VRSVEFDLLSKEEFMKNVKACLVSALMVGACFLGITWASGAYASNLGCTFTEGPANSLAAQTYSLQAQLKPQDLGAGNTVSIAEIKGQARMDPTMSFDVFAGTPGNLPTLSIDVTDTSTGYPGSAENENGNSGVVVVYFEKPKVGGIRIECQITN